MTELLLFSSTFVLVFALGFQSLNVNGGHYVAAFFTSFLIGGSNLVLFKLAPEATGAEIWAFMTGGPLGIVASMWLHKQTIGKRKHKCQSKINHKHSSMPDEWQPPTIATSRTETGK